MHPTLLLCLLTGEPRVHPLVEWLQSPEKAALFITVVGGAIITVIVTAYVKIGKAKRELDMAAADKPVAPMITPPAPPPPAQPQTASAAELQAAIARNMSTEVVLLETQQAVARIRAAMDERARAAAREEGALSAALIAERAENERLRARVAELEKRGAELVEQMRKDRAEPPSLPPVRKLRSVPPPRGRRDR